MSSFQITSLSRILNAFQVENLKFKLDQICHANYLLSLTPGPTFAQTPSLWALDMTFSFKKNPEISLTLKLISYSHVQH